jgi:hypothetical protein
MQKIIAFTIAIALAANAQKIEIDFNRLIKGREPYGGSACKFQALPIRAVAARTFGFGPRVPPPPYSFGLVRCFGYIADGAPVKAERSPSCQAAPPGGRKISRMWPSVPRYTTELS